MSKDPVADDQIVTVIYTLKNADGDLLESSAGGPPLAYLHGHKNIVPGLEQALTGKQPGDKVSVVVEPAAGYGERMGPEPQAVPRSAFPEDADLEEGMQIFAQGPQGRPFPLWVVGVSDEHITLDHNHPLAGETLHFEVEIVGVREATAEELEHGHPHAPGGHHHH